VVLVIGLSLLVYLGGIVVAVVFVDLSVVVVGLSILFYLGCVTAVVPDIGLSDIMFTNNFEFPESLTLVFNAFPVYNSFFSLSSVLFFFSPSLNTFEFVLVTSPF
jgi:hypothetical protein